MTLQVLSEDGDSLFVNSPSFGDSGFNMALVWQSSAELWLLWHRKRAAKSVNAALVRQRVSGEKGVLYGNGNILQMDTRNKLTKQFEINPDSGV